MSHIEPMLRSHPRRPPQDLDVIAACVRACFDCAAACNSCADACLAEPMVAELVGCIRLNRDCADVCITTGLVVSRETQPDGALLRHVLEACAVACATCAEECERHASEHEHCRVCAEACRACEQACRALLGTYGIQA